MTLAFVSLSRYFLSHYLKANVFFASTFFKVTTPFLYLEAKMKAFRHASQTTFSTLNFSSFEKIATDFSVEDPLSAARLLHKLGIIRFYEDAADDVIVLDPQWIVNMYTYLVKCEGTGVIQDGILLDEKMCQVWAPPEYPPKFLPLIRSLLLSAGLIYPIDSLPNNYIRRHFSIGSSEVVSPKSRGRSYSQASPSTPRSNPVSPRSPPLSPSALSPPLLPTSAAPSLLKAYLIPSLLSRERPKQANFQKASMYSEQATGGKYGRDYLLEYLPPPTFFPRLLIQFMQIPSWTPEAHWATGILISSDEDKTKVTSHAHPRRMRTHTH